MIRCSESGEASPCGAIPFPLIGQAEFIQRCLRIQLFSQKMGHNLTKLDDLRVQARRRRNVAESHIGSWFWQDITMNLGDALAHRFA